MPKLTCFGGVGAVTGANFLLEVGGKRVLVDCGLLQGGPDAHDTNAREFDYDPSSIDMVFITHAHIDHIGLVPKLVKQGFKGKVYSTEATKQIAELMLMDMSKINGSNARLHGGEPLYGDKDVHDAMLLWHGLPYHTEQDFSGFKLTLLDAGHILGSAMYKFMFADGSSMLFSGDIGNSPSPILKETEHVKGLTYLLMDSVYGDRNHDSKEERNKKFTELIREVASSGRTLLIPAFSLERTQDLLFILDDMFESKLVPEIPVFLDSPLSIRVTEIYERMKGLYNDKAEEEIREGDDIFKFKRLKETSQVRDSREIALVQGAKIIIAGSGMSTAGRILAHEEMYLPDPKTSILFAGYQAAGTLGRQIAEGVKEVKIDGKTVKVRARVENIDGFSAHADSNALVDFASASAGTLKKVFVTMGEPKSSIFLAQRLRDELGVDAVVPERGKSYELGL